MTPATRETNDPRIRRTRKLLQQGLEKLLQVKDFDKISVHDIAEAATVNRVTFYDHYPDKFALLECTVGSRFQELLNERGVQFDGGCSSALTAIVLGVCDYLAGVRGSRLQTEPHLESAIIAVVRRLLLEGLRGHPPGGAIPSEMIAATLGWAIYGAAYEWVQTPNRASSEQIAETIVSLVSPILHPLPAPAPVSSDLMARP